MQTLAREDGGVFNRFPGNLQDVLVGGVALPPPREEVEKVAFIRSRAVALGLVLAREDVGDVAGDPDLHVFQHRPPQREEPIHLQEVR